LVVGLLVGWWFYALSAVICNSPFNYFRFVICPGGIPVAGGGLSYAPPLCLFQGFMYELGYLAFLVAWSLISVHSALAVLLKRTDVFNRRTMILSYGLLIGIPLFLAMLVTANKQTGARSSIVYCVPLTIESWAWGTFYGWICLAIVICSISTGIVIYQMLQVSDPTSSFSVRNNLRVLLFLIIGLLWAVTFIAQRGWIEAYSGPYSTRWTAGVNVNAACSIFQDDCP